MGIRVKVLDQNTDVARKWGPLALEDVGRGGVGPCHKGLPECEISTTCFHFPMCLQLSVWNWALLCHLRCTLPGGPFLPWPGGSLLLSI